jgi:hypothetical protein
MICLYKTSILSKQFQLARLFRTEMSLATHRFWPRSKIMLPAESTKTQSKSCSLFNFKNEIDMTQQSVTQFMFTSTLIVLGLWSSLRAPSPLWRCFGVGESGFAGAM